MIIIENQSGTWNDTFRMLSFKIGWRGTGPTNPQKITYVIMTTARAFHQVFFIR